MISVLVALVIGQSPAYPPSIRQAPPQLPDVIVIPPKLQSKWRDVRQEEEEARSLYVEASRRFLDVEESIRCFIVLGIEDVAKCRQQRLKLPAVYFPCYKIMGAGEYAVRADDIPGTTCGMMQYKER